MKLFPKLVLIISCLIVFQAFFTGLFISNLIRISNREDAREQLRYEADFISSNFFLLEAPPLEAVNPYKDVLRIFR